MDVTDPRSGNPLVGFYSGYSDERNATIGTVQKVDGRSLTLERKAVNILDFQELWVFTLLIIGTSRHAEENVCLI